ncbi:SDR family oxidoreductase [Gordonia sp. DT218]|uniref:SDR family oxidoreductase n=1 Tax=unclassified Gordonia (in: high G+C Gram-positive bacteria) TaxID=2657482 RepID=UPI003CEE5B81
MILDRFRLDGKVAVVTGAGRGLGAATAVGFAEAGADVVISARTEADLADVADAVAAAGRRALVVPADLSTTDPGVLASAAVDEFGRLDIVVNNVGGSYPKPLIDTSVDDLARAFDFNVATAHSLVLAAVPHLRRSPGGGSIINIASAVGRLPGRAFVAYGTVKAALIHYTKLTALDLNPHIRVNAIAPGSILTSSLETVAADDALRAEIESRTPLRRLGEPADIAAAAVFLASEAGSFLTGKVIESDGGLIAPNFELAVADV